jgi:hypothetical protein
MQSGSADIPAAAEPFHPNPGNKNFPSTVAIDRIAYLEGTPDERAFDMSRGSLAWIVA